MLASASPSSAPASAGSLAAMLPGGCWGAGGGGGVRHRKMGGIFHARVRPTEKITLRAIRDEAHLRRRGISRYNKRWRSWAQNRVRHFQLALPVTLTSDTSLMNTQYITGCVQKAASLRKNDVKLWHGYSKRILELQDELEAEQLGYILWGYAKSSFLDGNFYREIMPTVKARLPEFQSHALMSLMWCMKQVKWKDRDLLTSVAQHTLDSIDALRPSDFIKVSNALASLGLRNTSLCERISGVAIAKFEETFAQQFRDAVNPVAIGCLWNDEVSQYILERFQRIFITARPHHLLKAYESVVVARVQAPQVWRALPHDTKQFYVRLSQRHIPDIGQEPSSLHWDVSRHLAELGEAHRNSFRWGPFGIDVGLEELEDDERRRCIMVDGPSSFYFGTDQYLPPKKLQHRMLSSLGWDIRRVRWDDWVDLELDGEKKRPYLETLLSGAGHVGEELADRPEAPPEVVKGKLRKLREVLLQAAAAEKAAKEARQIDFDV